MKVRCVSHVRVCGCLLLAFGTKAHDVRVERTPGTTLFVRAFVSRAARLQPFATVVVVKSVSEIPGLRTGEAGKQTEAKVNA